ncbi:hypothetical protein AgCh_017701 [Apium graveolens]
MIITSDDCDGIESLKRELAHYFAMKDLKRELAHYFAMKDLGVLRYFLEIEVASSPKGYLLCQSKYIADLLDRARLTDNKTVETPLEMNTRYSPSDGLPLTDPTLYRTIVEAEYRAMASTTCEIVWLRRLLADLGVSLPSSTLLYCDNKSAIHIARNSHEITSIKTYFDEIQVKQQFELRKTIKIITERDDALEKNQEDTARQQKVLISVLDDQQTMSSGFVTSVDIRGGKGKQIFKAVKEFISEAIIHG